MNKDSNTYNAALNSFFETNREKSLRFLQHRFAMLSPQDIEDIYQEASLVLYTKIVKGLFQQLDCSLYTYFLSICINLSLKQMSVNDKFVDLSSIDTPCSNHVQEDKLTELETLVYSQQEDTQDYEFQDWIEQKVYNCVREMKPPCNHILHSFYWDGFSHKTIAELYGMKNEDVCKTQANRCRNKFKEYIKKLISSYGK